MGGFVWQWHVCNKWYFLVINNSVCCCHFFCLQQILTRVTIRKRWNAENWAKWKYLPLVTSQFWILPRVRHSKSHHCKIPIFKGTNRNTHCSCTNCFIVTRKNKTDQPSLTSARHIFFNLHKKNTTHHKMSSGYKVQVYLLLIDTILGTGALPVVYILIPIFL